MSQELSVVGKRLPRPDGIEEASGAAKYTADINLPGILAAKVLRSPYPHAEILKVDTSKAERLPGVEAVITFEDVPRIPFTIYCLGILRDPEITPEIRDQYVLCDKARHVGDAVAAVAAVTQSIAEEALGLIEVEYRQLPAVFDPGEAIKPDAPRIHDYAENNVAQRAPFIYSRGDVEKGFEEADYLAEGTFSTTKQAYCQLEPTTTIASFDNKGRLTVWSPSQQPHLAKGQIARLFEMPEGMVKWLTPHIGGAFGMKQSFVDEPICIVLARKTGLPVKLEGSRVEDFVARETRQPLILTGKLGVKKDGTITALQAKLIADAGAYFSHSGATTGNGIRRFLGLYRCPNVDGETDIVYTNTPVAGGMRGYGNPQTAFAREQLIDMAAEKIGMDPLEFRLKNIKITGELSDVPSVPIESCALDECIKVGAERICWEEKRKARKQGVTRRGVGMACALHGSNASPGVLEHSSAFIKLNADGSANVIASVCEMGQGVTGVLSQIAAEELGLNIKDIHMVTGDTDVTLFDVGAHASRSTYAMGNAVLEAAREAKGQLLERASRALNVSTGELDAKEGYVYVKATPEKRNSIADIVRKTIYDYQQDFANILGTGRFKASKSDSFQATFVEVEVDTESGQVKVLKVVIAVDIGRAINPMNVEGQCEGAIVQGIGYTLTENYVVDRDTGIPTTDSFETYRIPTTLDIPEIEVIIVERPVASGPFGAKGCSELPIVAVAPAIANAIYNAVGVRVRDLPITPEKILNSLETETKTIGS